MIGIVLADTHHLARQDGGEKGVRVEPHRVECRVPRDDELGRLIAGRVEQRFLARQRVRRLRHLAPVGPFAKQGSFE